MTSSSDVAIFRFAPSPNGLLHLGHAYSALLNWERAQECGGRFLLRIEDIDLSRARPAFEAAIYEDLAWLGLDWERPVRRQSEHLDDYREMLQRLYAEGLLYPCRCTRQDIVRSAGEHGPCDPDGVRIYPGTCRKRPKPSFGAALSSGAALRLDMGLASAGRSLSWVEEEVGEVAAHPEAWGDVVLARKDVPTSYHLAVTVDDALQGVTEVVRGEDLFHVTGVHRLLQDLLGLPQPHYRHHGLATDEVGAKLSKSRSSRPLRDLRAEGVTAEEARRLAKLSARRSA